MKQNIPVSFWSREGFRDPLFEVNPPVFGVCEFRYLVIGDPDTLHDLPLVFRGASLCHGLAFLSLGLRLQLVFDGLHLE